MWYTLHVNPEPWAVGPLDVGRNNGKIYPRMGQNQQLAAYQEAVREELESQVTTPLLEGDIDLKFWFWRHRAEYTTAAARQHRKHEADGTNMAKALEDALQGVLFANDRDVKHLEWFIVEQGPDVQPGVVIKASPCTQDPRVFIPSDVLYAARFTVPAAQQVDLNAWPPRD